MHRTRLTASPFSPKPRRLMEPLALARTADPVLADRRRREILDAAIACFRRSGFHQTGMQAICAQANISPGALYRYFDSKAEIIAAIAEEDRRDLAAILCGVLTSGGVVDDLIRSANLIMERHFAGTSAALVADVIGEAVRDPALGARLAKIDEGAQAHLADALRRGQARGEVDTALDPDTAAYVLFAALDGLALRTAVLRGENPSTILEDFRNLAARYLAPQGQAGGP